MDLTGLNGAAAGSSNSIGSSVGGLIGTAGGAMLGPFGAAIGGSLGSSIGGLFGKKKVSAPPPPTGAQSGAWANDYYNAAFPGTTPWERLGTSNPSGQVASTTMETNTQARSADSERKFQYDNMKLDTMSRWMDIALKKSQLDISQQEVDVRKKEYGLKEKLNPSEIYRNENSGVFGGAKTTIKEYPWMLGLLGLSGAAKGASYAANAFKTFQMGRKAALGAKMLKDAPKTVPGNMGKWSKSFKKGYTNPYSGKKIPD